MCTGKKNKGNSVKSGRFVDYSGSCSRRGKRKRAKRNWSMLSLRLAKSSGKIVLDSEKLFRSGSASARALFVVLRPLYRYIG